MTELRWTAEQSAALTAEGHRLLVANAGTGKTTTVVHKILWLLGEAVGLTESGEPIPRCTNTCGLEEIAAITFTEKAAYDLKRKLREELRKSPRADELLWDLERATLGTIHSFCGQLLREHALRMGIDPGFTVLDEQDAKLQQDLIIRDVILEQLKTDDRETAELVRKYGLRGFKYTNGAIDLVRTAFRDLRWRESRYANWCANGELDRARIEQVFQGALDINDQNVLSRCRGLHRMAALTIARWRRFEEAENLRDFDSLILDTRNLLTSPDGAAALSDIRRRYRILIIDEFQDTDDAQRDIAYAIARPVDRPQLFLVGDPKQSIYRFRGAEVSVWNAVQDDLSRAAPPLPLSVNFRSEPPIIGFVNAVGTRAFSQAAAELARTCGDASVPYTSLSAHRTSGVGAVEWIIAEGGDETRRRKSEAAHVAQRIAELVDREPIVDPHTREPRPCRYSDIAVLYRARTGLSAFHDALQQWGIPFFEHSPVGLAERQEVLDLLNVLRLLHNPADDLCAFAYLRSPFVGLRDEVLVRLRMNGGYGRYLDQARDYLRRDDWFVAPEHVAISDIEKDALRAGLNLFHRAHNLAERLPIDELLEFMLTESGYRQHLLLLDGSREALANIRSFLHMVEQYRDHTIGRFLAVWDSRDAEDPGVPQGQLFGAAEDVVTLSTIHSAKGLEWPVVFLVDLSAKFNDQNWGQYWSDPRLGPVLCPVSKEHGSRSRTIATRDIVREQAERARLLYVASTRARDRLLILAADVKHTSFLRWLQAGLDHCTIQERPTPEFAGAALPAIHLSWLNVVQPGEAARTAPPLPNPPHKFMTSATEEMVRTGDPELWALLYLHGMEPVWQFAPRGRRKALPERLRGDLIHGVLERITPEIAIAQVLEETIGELAAPELEFVLAPGTEQRAEIEAEIERVITGEEWKWYVAGEHYRELPFLHLVAPREWRIGAFDLYRPDGWIIDFKTHQLTADRIARAAEDYRLQMRIYREAAGIAVVVKTRLHFTHSNSVIDLS